MLSQVPESGHGAPRLANSATARRPTRTGHSPWPGRGLNFPSIGYVALLGSSRGVVKVAAIAENMELRLETVCALSRQVLPDPLWA